MDPPPVEFLRRDTRPFNLKEIENDKSIVIKITELYSHKLTLQSKLINLYTKKIELGDREVIQIIQDEILQLDHEIDQLYQDRIRKSSFEAPTINSGIFQIDAPAINLEMFQIVLTALQKRESPVCLALEDMPKDFNANVFSAYYDPEQGIVLEDPLKGKILLQQNGAETDPISLGLKKFGLFFLFIALTAREIKPCIIDCNYDFPFYFDFSDQLHCAWLSPDKETLQVQSGKNYERGNDLEIFGLTVVEKENCILIKSPFSRNLTRVNQGLERLQVLYNACKRG